jgi:hypothetical protein
MEWSGVDRHRHRRHDGRADRGGKARNAIGRRKRRHHSRPERCEAMNEGARNNPHPQTAVPLARRPRLALSMPICQGAVARPHMTGPLLLCHGRSGRQCGGTATVLVVLGGLNSLTAFNGVTRAVTRMSRSLFVVETSR